jgi:hypothetical protein
VELEFKFLVDNLEPLVDKFPTIGIRYAIEKNYESYSKYSHYIEIFPESLYNDESFIEEAILIIEDFLSRFPGTLICFIKEKDLFEIENPIYTNEGKDYDYNKR